MADYINREELLERKRPFQYYNGKIHDDECVYAVTVHDINTMPSIDAVEVVRCKDCKWYQSVYGTCSKFSFKNGNNYNEYCAVVEKDFFCKWGEKE